MALYVLAGAAYLTWRTEFTLVTYTIYADKLIGFALVLAPLASVVWLAFRSIWLAPRTPYQYFRQQFTNRAMARYVTGILLLLLLIPFYGTFTQIKGSLSADGFVAETVIANAEAWIHGGIDPAEWLAKTFGGSRILQWAEVNYNVGWQAYNLLFLSFMVLHPAMYRARQFYLAMYFGLWVVLGNLMAGWWIAAGPCFYAEVTGDHTRFATLQDMLLAGKDDAHSAYRLQQYLWHWWRVGASALGTGVAAFPSVHVAVVTCNAWFMFRYLGRCPGVIAALYACVILVSSVYLGWHYLLDGYVASAVALVLTTCCFRLDQRRSGNCRLSSRP